MDLLPPIAELTTDDRGPILIVYTYILVINTLLFTSIKVFSTVLLKRKLDWDDFCASAAGILALVQSIVTERSAINGAGRFQESLSRHDLEIFSKRALVSNILSITVQSLAKLAAVYLIQRLSAISTSKLTFRILYTSIACWFVFSFFALLFQCGTPGTTIYDTSRCPSTAGVWYAVLTTNILTDLAIALVFMPIVFNLQIALSAKWRISMLFAARLIVCALTIGQIVLWASASYNQDVTRAYLSPAVIGQFVMNFSILTAVAPSLYRFLNELSSGTGFGGLIDRSQYELSSYSAGQSGAKKKRSSTYVRMSDKSKPTFRPDIKDGGACDTTISSNRRPSVRSADDDQGSEDLIIRQTTAWSVRTYNDNTIKSPKPL